MWKKTEEGNYELLWNAFQATLASKNKQKNIYTQKSR